MYRKGLCQNARQAVKDNSGQKNNTANDGVQYKLRGYSEKQISNWSASKNIVIHENEQQLRQFIDDARNGKNLSKKMYFGSISESLANRIKRDTDVDVESYNCTLRASEIRKIYSDHGDEFTESQRGQRAITEDDFVSIPQIIQNPDEIKLSDTLYQGKPIIEFIKTINGRTTVKAYVSKKHLDLTVQTMYSGKNKRNLATVAGKQAPANTPKANVGTVPNDIIPNPSKKVNENNSTQFSVRDNRIDYTNIDLSTLDDKQLRVYNKRGWANSLFTDEDLVLLSEKYNELNQKTRQRTDNVLGDGSRIVEVNNKLVLIGGTFNDPIIHNVLAINADNETDADLIKEFIYNESSSYRANQDEYSQFLEYVQIIEGEEFVRTYSANDFKYFKGRNTERATLPSNFKNYGYTEQFKDRGRNNSEAKQFSVERGRDLSDDELIERAVVKSEQTPDFEALFEDEDLSFDFVTQSGKERFEKLLKDNPTLALDTVYSSFANAILKKLNISPQMPEVRYNYTIKKILSDYNIEATQRAEFEEILRKFIGAVKNNEADFPEAFNEFIAGCKQTLNFSSVPHENETLKTVKEVVKGIKIVIPDEAVSEINSNYGSIRNYRNKLLGHKVYVTLEKNVGTDLSKVNNAVRIDDLAVDILSELGYDVYNGATAYEYDGHEWDSLGGFYNLEHLLNDPKLATRYSNPYLDGHSETIDVAAVQMAFDTMIEFLSLTNGTIENYRQALNKAKQENYKAESTILKYKKILTEIDEINTISEKLGEFEGTDNEELLKRKKELLDKLKTQAPIRQLLAEQRKNPTCK